MQVLGRKGAPGAGALGTARVPIDVASVQLSPKYPQSSKTLVLSSQIWRDLVSHLAGLGTHWVEDIAENCVFIPI